MGYCRRNKNTFGNLPIGASMLGVYHIMRKQIKVFDNLIGETIIDLVVDTANKEVQLHLLCGRSFKLYHNQDCCEEFSVEGIDGGIEGILNSPLLLAEHVSIHKEVDGYGSETSHWYKLGMIKDTITLRFIGSSNGYYSEAVDFIEIDTEG
jgi:hypothetical protein